MNRPGRRRRSGQGFGRAVAHTAANNIVMTVASATAGVILARSLGPSERGEYAAVVVWFAFTLIIGELGLTAATTYYVSRSKDRRRDYLATTRGLMTMSGGATATLGWFLSPILGHHDPDLAFSYRLMFVACVPAFVGASYVFGLQASNIKSWNLLRISQPLPQLAAILALHLAGALTLRSAVYSLAITVTAQAIFGYFLCRREQLTGGRFDRHLAPPLLRYGLSQLLASAPTVLNARLDQLVLSQTVRSAALGQYAVAVTLTSLCVPIVAAIGNVAFPRLAAMTSHGEDERRLQRRSILAACFIATGSTLVIAGTAAWVVPFLFGPGFEPAVPLVWLLAPGGAFLAVGQVTGDLLRGRGQPLAVAWAQGAAALLTVVLLLALLPVWGVKGAAVASTVAYLVALVIMLAWLRRATPHHSTDSGVSPLPSKSS